MRVLGGKGGRSKDKVFSCSVCGDCCTGFSLTVDPWVEDGQVHLIRDGSIGVEVWPWEARIMLKMSMATDAGLVLLPSNLRVDSKRGLPIAISYIIANDICPFVMDRKCTIYEDRPNVCRYFPLVLARAGVRTSDRCPETVTPKMGSSGKANADALRRTYPDGIPYLQSDLYVHERLIDLLGRLEMEGHVEWDFRPDPDEVLKKVKDQQWMDLLEFIVDIDAMTMKDVEDLVRDLVYIENIDDKVDFKLLTL